MGILSNISLEVISLEVIRIPCIWLQLLSVKPAHFMKNRTECWQENKSNCHPWHFHSVLADKVSSGALHCQAGENSSAADTQTARLGCWYSAVPQARRCQKHWKQTQTGPSFSYANVLSTIWGAMLWLSQSPFSITAFYAAEHMWQAQSIWKNKILGCHQGSDWKT